MEIGLISGDHDHFMVLFKEQYITFHLNAKEESTITNLKVLDLTKFYPEKNKISITAVY